MADVIFVSIVFLIAGFAKGLVGMGLPLIAMGLLVFRLDSVTAAGLVILPSMLSNGVQSVAGGAFRQILSRFWPVFACSALATLILPGAMARAGSQALFLLGAILVLFGLYRLWGLGARITPRQEKWLGPIIGILTGMTTALTGVFSVPVVPWFNALGLDRHQLIQAMSLSFMVSVVTLAINLGMSGGWHLVTPVQGLVAIIGSFAGIWLGTRLRNALDEDVFQKYFLWSLIILGTSLMAKPFIAV